MQKWERLLAQTVVLNSLINYDEDWILFIIYPVEFCTCLAESPCTFFFFLIEAKAQFILFC